MEIPNLWPTEALKIDVVSPAAILRIQAAALQEMTQGVLTGEVRTVIGKTRTELALDIAVPVLNYRCRLLSATHSNDFVYPVLLEGDMFHGLVSGAVEHTAHSQEQFVEMVGDILRSPHVVAMLQSLIARYNEREHKPNSYHSAVKAELSAMGSSNGPIRT